MRTKKTEAYGRRQTKMEIYGEGVLRTVVTEKKRKSLRFIFIFPFFCFPTSERLRRESLFLFYLCYTVRVLFFVCVLVEKEVVGNC